MTLLEIAQGYISRGWNPTPVEYRGKRPIGNGWQRRIIDAGNVAEHFNGEQLNIGVVLGPSSHQLTDVDEDADVAISIGLYILPQTNARFGRSSKRDSHRLYYTDLSAADRPAAIAFDDPRKPKQQGRLIELRIGGHSGAQSVLPGSVHKSGETVTWEEDGTPATVGGEDLLQRVRIVAAYSLMARYWPAEGSGHHDTARVVGGFLARTGLGPETVRTHVEAITRAANSPRWRELCRTAEDAVKALAAGKHAFGLNGLREAFGADIAEKVCEWLDYKGPQETNSGDATRAAASSSPHSWDDPDISILDDRRGELPDFPIDVLTLAWQGWLKRAAHGAGVRPEHIAIPLLGVASSLIGTARRVCASRSWSEPVTLWGCIVADSGDRKTSGLRVITRALDLIEATNAPGNSAKRIAHETKVQRSKEVAEKWKDDRKAALKEVPPREPPVMPVDAINPGNFIEPRLYVTDPTIERLAELLNARPRGMLLIRDELSGLFANMARYSTGSDRPFWLEAFNGGRHVVERKTTGTIIVDHLLVGIVGTFQPDRLAAAFARDEDGMYSRFLYAWPVAPIYKPLTNEVGEIEPEIVSALTALIRLSAEDAAGAFTAQPIWLSDEAIAEFEEFRKWSDKTKHGFEGRERHWFVKGEVHVLRLAGALAFMAWAIALGTGSANGLDGITAALEPKTIAKQFMTDAIRLWREFLWPHARAAMRQIGLTDRHRDARRVLIWLRNNPEVREASVKDIRRDALAQSLDAEGTEALLNSLVAAGWLRPKPAPKAEGPGRPVHRWLINPLLYGRAGNAGNAEIA
jgi:hypothetical protein